MPDAVPDGSFAFLDGAARLGDISARLNSLAGVFDQRVVALVARFASLPATADFDPFLAVLDQGAAALAGAAAAGPTSRTRRAPATTAATAARARAATAAAARGSAVAPSRPPGASSGSAQPEPAGSLESALGLLPGQALPRGDTGFTLASMLNGGVGLGLDCVTRGLAQPAPASLAQGALQASSLAAQAVADLIGRAAQAGAVPPRAAFALPDLGAAFAPTPAGAVIERQLATIAASVVAFAKQAAAPFTPSSRAGAPTPVGPLPRAPSRLVGRCAAPASDTFSAAATAAPAGGLAAPAAALPAQAAPAGGDDVVAAINRMLVDQAWLRGVDLR